MFQLNIMIHFLFATHLSPILYFHRNNPSLNINIIQILLNDVFTDIYIYIYTRLLLRFYSPMFPSTETRFNLFSRLSFRALEQALFGVRDILIALFMCMCVLCVCNVKVNKHRKCVSAVEFWRFIEEKELQCAEITDIQWRKSKASIGLQYGSHWLANSTSG